MTSLKKIKQYLTCLPNNDIILGVKLFDNREFESLLELVDSCIFLCKKKMKENVLNYAYLPGLNKLKIEIEDYLSYLDVEEENIDFIENENIYEIEEENYD